MPFMAAGLLKKNEVESCFREVQRQLIKTELGINTRLMQKGIDVKRVHDVLIDQHIAKE
jgi:hypothetical protein